MRVVTIAERRQEELARLVASVARVTTELGDYSRRTGAHFVIFGSLARGDFIETSDLDVLVEGPEERLRPARNFAKDLCERNSLRHDIHLASEVSEPLMMRIRRDGRRVA